MASFSASPVDGQATHYEILGLSPDLVAQQQNPSKLIKQAYHRSLLHNHPDKASSSTTTTVPKQHHGSYTIDQISTAFGVLSSPQQRALYDASLRTLRRPASLPAGVSSGFQTGVETVDLDDLAFDEGLECWHRSCRCGNDRGYLFHEADLVEAEDDGELMVGCQDCSLWLRVHFVALEDENEEVEGRGAPMTTASSQDAQILDKT
ncbi:hypothetical protein S40285_03416 [Stachybotrys chlorohalonatus IBT 40285]|jgi:curved DNA-binding protein CbpA|uniref:Diphthamide biosynthesis protein 4 n=1 Tax=Stachybotrys chlorohalonatus (strain IBT 40285) TaxID=1283841 RepID=A0A084QBU5_STAC4|nr:hypothetical protein S40285_03416 [Stachybotrys chlorohalonata IBT 40285]